MKTLRRSQKRQRLGGGLHPITSYSVTRYTLQMLRMLHNTKQKCSNLNIIVDIWGEIC